MVGSGGLQLSRDGRLARLHLPAGEAGAGTGSEFPLEAGRRVQDIFGLRGEQIEIGASVRRRRTPSDEGLRISTNQVAFGKIGRANERDRTLSSRVMINTCAVSFS